MKMWCESKQSTATMHNGMLEMLSVRYTFSVSHFAEHAELLRCHCQEKKKRILLLSAKFLVCENVQRN